MEKTIESVADMLEYGVAIGRATQGGQVFELVGDVGAGKTTFVKGLAQGLDIDDDVQSPSFTISRVYDARDGLHLAHYDFYRLDSPGVMQLELFEATHDEQAVVVVEWSGIVEDVLPADRVTIRFTSPSETTRVVSLSAGGQKSQQLLEVLA